MPIEYKDTVQFTKEISDRTVVGIYAVHGVVDDGMDRSHPGAFADTKVNGRDRAVFLWQHDASAPPVASILSLRELTRDELPPAVLAYAPDATGAAEVTREYLDTPRGNEILAGLKAGAIREMSYAYDVAEYKFTEAEDGKTIRELYKLKLFDVSDVCWGLNSSTSAVKRMPLAAHSDSVLAAVEEYIDRVKDLSALRAKEGRVLSGESRKRIETAVEALAGASAALKDLLAATEPKQQVDIRLLMLQTQRTLATLNGVT
jgi:HK97 family phage prohead protease